jgi:hypothetical protein
MKNFKRLVMLPFAAIFLNLGCSQVRSYEEREVLYSRVAEQDLQQLVESIDLLLLMEQKSHLSKWRED